VTHRIEAVTSSRSAEFDAAYGALAAEFGPRGELERREVVARWLDSAASAAGPPPAATTAGRFQRTYHLLVARDEAGALAGIRDCHVVLDLPNRVAVVYLAHAFVSPPFRRSGLGALFRAEPIAIAQRALAAAGIEVADVVLAAEMEPAALDDPPSLVRLVAYGKDGFAAISPAALPYFQPDFRDLDAVAGAPRPIPLLAVVRFIGHEGASTLPKRLARAFVEHLYEVFATHVRREHLAVLSKWTLAALDASAGDDIALLALPRTTADHASFLPLSRDAVQRIFPTDIEDACNPIA
jgi:hypothetical protein